MIPDEIHRLIPFRSEYLRLSHPEAIRLHYFDEGPRQSDQPPLICVHGNPTWSFYFRKVLTAFRQERRVIALDHIGCGLSSKPQKYPYHLRQHIDNFSVFMEQVCPEGEVDLLLHDWGGAIALGWAVHRPEKVRKIILTNTAGFRSRHIPVRIAAGKLPVLGDYAIRGLNLFARAALLMAAKKPLSKEVRQALLWPYRNYQDRIALLRFVQDIPLHAAHPSWKTLTDIEEHLSALPQGLILWGEKDFCFNQHFLKRWQQIWPDALVRRFPEGGHYLLEDESEGCLKAIREYLN